MLSDEAKEMNSKSGASGDLSAYTKTRYQLDEKRKIVWRVLAPFLQKKFHFQGSILDVGCGFGDFINNVSAHQRSALDMNPEMKPFLDSDIQFQAGPVSELRRLFTTQSYDLIFSSNLLEHLSREEISQFFLDAKQLLKTGGSLLILMPNYRKCSAEYFDDYTHLTPLSDRSLSDWLNAAGFVVDFVDPGFMPFSVKDSKLPITAWLIKLWLLSPFKPGGKQMLIRAKNKE